MTYVRETIQRAGYEHAFVFLQHDPDLPDGDRVSVLIDHNSAIDGTPCSMSVALNGPVTNEFYPHWTVQYYTAEQLKPLTITEEIICPVCGDRGFMRADRWELT